MSKPKKFKLLLVKDRSKEKHMLPIKKKQDIPIVIDKTIPYYINNYDISSAGIVSAGSSIIKQNRKEDELLLNIIKDKDVYNIKLVDVYNDGDECIYNCYMLLKLNEIDVSDDPSIFVPEIRKGLYDYFTSLSKEDRVKYFQTGMNTLESDNDKRKKFLRLSLSDSNTFIPV